MNAPKGVLTASLRAEIKNRKKEILAYLSCDTQSKLCYLAPITPASGSGPWPLSFAQERLWLLDQLEPQNPVYNFAWAARLSGPLKLDALSQSLNAVLHRHTILRTTFPIVDGRPVQVIASEHNLALDVSDLRRFSPTDRELEIERKIIAEIHRPFDLVRGPMIRTTVLKLTDEEHIIMMVIHHILTDAWSMAILRRELSVLYNSFYSGEVAPLDTLPIQYADYAVRQLERLRGEVLQTLLSYWTKRLGRNLTVLALPSDRPRPVRQTYDGAKVPVVLPHFLTAALKALGEQCNVTLFMILAAGFKVLLYRYTGQDDIVIGSPMANRNVKELERLIGLFVNMLVLRTDLSGSPSFQELLLRVRDVCLGAYDHQDLPFERLVEELEPQRDLARNPLFQVAFSLRNAPRATLELSEIAYHPVDIKLNMAKFDLSLALVEREGWISGFFGYATDLFDHATIERMARHYRTLLERIVLDPNQSISTLAILTHAERHQLLEEWNDTAEIYPRDKCIHELFDAQLKGVPNRTAIEFQGKSLTYMDLDARANQLAGYLINLGVGPGMLVGIYVERSLEMVVGLLGILKAGGAYVPLDPSYPEERLRFMLQDAQCSVLLTQERIIEDGKWRIEDGYPRSSILDSRLTIICLDRDWPCIRECSIQNPNVALSSDSLAYVIYTSGSSGQPKGVGVSHRSVVNCLCSIGERLGFTDRDVLLAVTTISFDIAALELYLPLLSGGRVVLASREEGVEGRELLRRLKETSASVMQATPSSWRMLIEAGWKGARGFKILCGGESMSRDLAEGLLRRGEVWNLYGPTEAAIWSTIQKVESAEGAVPIGRPIANTQTYILDANFEPVPIGVQGELYIGGEGVGRGYLNRPELTAERFIPNPFSDDPNARLYRTGDRARYRADGNIEFLGRNDNQVKIRGHRVELGEIEAALNQHPKIHQSVVIASDAEISDSANPKSAIQNPKSLVAYVVPANEKPPVVELRSFLQKKLPEYMIPSVFVVLDALPLTANGKIDRNALPPPYAEKVERDQGWIEPRTEIEELVAQVWQRVLKLDNIGIHDNFFDLGGHSLLATQIVAGLRDMFSREVNLRAIFEKPTVAALAREIEEVIRAGSVVEVPPIVPVTRNEPLPLTINQEHLWRLDKLMPMSHFFNIPFVYLVSGVLNAEALKSALQTIVDRHEALRTVFTELNGYPVQTVKDESDCRLQIVDLQNECPDESLQRTASLLLEERRQGFDLAKGPLIRAKLLRLTRDKSFLLLTLHHLIGDYWSVQVFWREFISVYESTLQGRCLELPYVRVQFGDFALWERQQLGSELMTRQLAYWKKRLSGPLAPLEFRRAPGQKTHSGENRIVREIEITPILFAAVKELAKRETCSVYVVMLAALMTLVYLYTREPDIRIGTLMANRRRGEIQGVFGLFLNTVVIRTKISPAMTCTQLLRDVKSAALEAYANQEFPFEKLAQALEAEDHVDRCSLFQVLCNYQKVESELPTRAGITFASLRVDRFIGASEPAITAIDVIFNIRESSTALTVVVNCRSGVLDESQTLRMGEYLTKVLESLVLTGVRLDAVSLDL